MTAQGFQFFPWDWLKSQRVQVMTLEQEGAYIRLLCHCWVHGCIPIDPEQCARLIGKGAGRELASAVQSMFQPADGKLVHERLEMERARREAWRVKSVSAGKKGAAKRWKNGQGHRVGLTKAIGLAIGLAKETVVIPDSLILLGEPFAVEWSHFVEHRAAKKAKMTDHAKELILKTLSERPEKAVAALQVAQVRNWTGFKWDWYDNHENGDSKTHPGRPGRNAGTANEGTAKQYELPGGLHGYRG